jgi:hypothetical protein
MSCQASIDPGRLTLRQHLPHLSQPQATVWALWSVGMVLARSWALSAVSAMVAAVTGRQEHTLRQRLREWDDEASAQRGAPRQALPLETCLAPRWGWSVSGWQGRQLALALDAPTLGDRWVVLAVSVVERGGAMPVAWGLLPASPKHAWRGAGRRLWRRLGRVVPRHGPVRGRADRGLYAPWLLRRSVQRGWQPWWRRNPGGRGGPLGPGAVARCVPACRRLAPAGRDAGPPLPASPGAWTVRGGPAGRRGIKTRGGSGPLWPQPPARRGGRACGPGLSRPSS